MGKGKIGDKNRKRTELSLYRESSALYIIEMRHENEINNNFYCVGWKNKSTRRAMPPLLGDFGSRWHRVQPESRISPLGRHSIIHDTGSPGHEVRGCYEIIRMQPKAHYMDKPVLDHKHGLIQRALRAPDIPRPSTAKEDMVPCRRRPFFPTGIPAHLRGGVVLQNDLGFRLVVRQNEHDTTQKRDKLSDRCFRSSRRKP